ncbi:MAG: ketose-bisphosphate aldolase [Bacillaceae bacterium]|jgi:fructose-bisphosphate aldolase, class II|uniref:Fructose-bisphosphate aldolase n=2 Tax=Aeribacillus TaxID=1055323 RepID=A0A165Y416_9BACI|nr:MULTISPECIES: class II fructose-bisphosphate aldolase [Aeribacillus]AXI38920.1 ketose-bisphosphate aldolase [Bacillaceae bacterium ZC4]REJ19047.1 MAG: ketose-bisphosphate aldolase [Bacillaceae bacterium]ASS90041.1 fructose-bisphosphate aldolase [Aeribacillus pallidus]KZM56013.1 fructose-bisphosphate aldolase [Aeribacillus pallidus]KZN96706.1 fructose-bisphosphate aldolase [Aeribacillus pallidus]
MPLVTMREIFASAEEDNFGIGAFSVANMEMVMGAIQAAEELRSPIILQIAEVRLKHSPLHLIGPLMVEAAKQSVVPVAVHFDHGLTYEKIKQALDIGFTSVMYDGSHLPLKENIEKTKEIVKLANFYGATVEAEIGRVGGSEDGSEDIEITITGVEEAEKFAEETKVDALAIAIGNAHGVYKGEPNLRFDRLKEIDERVEIPLVLHGGSGIEENDFKECIKLGIRKINVATSTFNNVINHINKNVQSSCYTDYFVFHQDVIRAAYENVKYHIEIFGSSNRIEKLMQKI